MKPANRQRWIALSLFIAALCGVIVWQIWSNQHPSTDDAYVMGGVVAVAPRVSGPVVEVGAVDNGLVKKGGLLFRIDPSTFQAEVDRATAELALAKQQFESLDAEVKAAIAVVASRQAALENFESQVKRLQPLVAQGATTALDFDNVLERQKAASADLTEASEELEKAKAARGTLENNAAIQSATQTLRLAQLNLEYTRVLAPCDGWATNMNLQTGSYVSAGVEVFALVSQTGWWVAANYRETDLRHIQPGMKAEVRLKLYPGQVFHGTVQGISWGVNMENFTGNLLPAIDPTVDWVRLAQRFPVRIEMTDFDHAKSPLRMGASATVVVRRN